MTRCETIARLLPDVADDAATPAEAAAVACHVRRCTHCRIQLARERRLSVAIRELRTVDVDELFTEAVLRQIPAAPAPRRRDRRGLKLAMLAGLVALSAGLALPRGMFGAGLPSPSGPALPADVADPAGGALLALAQTLMMAVQAFFETPLVATTLGLLPAPLVVAALALVALGMAFGSTLVVLLAGACARH